MMQLDLVELVAILPHIKSLDSQIANSMAETIGALFGAKKR